MLIAKRITAALKAEVQRMANRGEPTAVIAEKLGISEFKVVQILNIRY